MKKACIYVNGLAAGVLKDTGNGHYEFTYDSDYIGPPVSLTMPLTQRHYEFTQFPPFFEGLLPEGIMLEALLRKYKIDRNDYFSQLVKVGQDLVGAINVEEME